ncbi:hypothetical protein HK099_004929 [Clydaea vesicula]|uniref:Transcription factor TFIIB cyclin-like domain-containing protein n=1 Tax=Clydaea vesicula TaxID=447962 RepID=A0AAD5TZS2_9FUNG|nr:hypothetical protein HK099_004929 [Clydaea vesicula]
MEVLHQNKSLCCSSKLVSLDDETGMVCSTCGEVDKQISCMNQFSMDHTEKEFDFNYNLSTNLQVRNRTKTKVNLTVNKINKIRQIISQQMSIAGYHNLVDIEARAQELCENALMIEEKEKKIQKKNLEHLILCCIYISLRENFFTITLHRLATVLNLKKYIFSLGKIFFKLKKIFKLTLVSLNSAQFFNVIFLKLKIHDEFLTKKCSEILNLMQNCGLDLGRRPELIAAACFTFAFGVKLRSTPKAITFLKVAASVEVKIDAMRERYKEVMNIMFEIGSKIAWIKGEFKKSDVFKYYPYILYYSDNLNTRKTESAKKSQLPIDVFSKKNYSDENSSLDSSDEYSEDDLNVETSNDGALNINTDIFLPPSFVKSKNRNLELTAKIQRARKRIKLMQEFFTSEGEEFLNLDEMDTIVEDLILQGQSDETILNKNWKKLI